MIFMSCKQRPIVMLACLLCVLMLLLPSQSDALDIPITIQNAAADGLARSKEPVVAGIPLPESANILNTSQLRVFNGSGKAVPAQISVAARWKGVATDTTKPIKWLFVRFQADTPASGKSGYVLKTASTASVAGQAIEIQNGAQEFKVNTGKAVFTISKTRFNLLESVLIDDDGAGVPDAQVMMQNGQGGLQLKDAQGKLFTTNLHAPEEMVIEESGPLHAVLRIRGVFKAADGKYFAPSLKNPASHPRFSQPYPNSFFHYNCRIHFYAGKSYVRVFLTIENNGAHGRSNPEQKFAPIQAVYFDSLEMVLKTPASGTRSIQTHDSQARLASADSFALYQDWKENLQDSLRSTLEPRFKDGIYYTTAKNGSSLTSGKMNPGWLDTSDGNLGITFAMRHFWQNFPKKLTATTSELRIGFWPSEGYYPYCRSADFPESALDMYARAAGRDAGLYLFDSGKHKTFELLLDFHSNAVAEEPQALSAMLEHPGVAHAQPSWYASTKALGMIASQGVGSSDPVIREALARFEKIQLANVDESASSNGWTIDKLKTADVPRGTYDKQSRYFGWMNFGDLLWDVQIPTGSHYDWNYSFLLHFLRTGNLKFYTSAVPMAKHRYDIDQYHGQRTDTNGEDFWINHMAFYEKDAHSDPSIATYMTSAVSKHSHTWNGGLILYYLLTGDRKAWEAAVENGEAALRWYTKMAAAPSCAASETRLETWPMLNLVNLYRVSGDKKYLTVARNIAVNRLLYREQSAGGQGLFGSGESCGSIDATRQSNTMYSYALDPMVQIHYEMAAAGDPDEAKIKAMILRMANFMMTKYLFGGDTSNGLYRPLQSVYIWTAADPQGTQRGEVGEPVKNTFNADLFAYAYLLSKDQKYLQWARKSFKDAMFYYTASGNKYLDPTYRSATSYIDSMFSSSESKIHGWLGRTNQVYLYMENQLSAPAPTPTPDPTPDPEPTPLPDGGKARALTGSKYLLLYSPRGWIEETPS